MRLKELKCKNCGANIKVEENASQAECKFCNTTFMIEDAYHDGYKFEKGRMKAHNEQVEKNLERTKSILGPVGKFFAAQYIISTIVGIGIFAIAIIIIIFIATRQSDSFAEFDIKSFNNRYEMYVGTEYGSSTGRLIDEIITNNKKNEKHQITIKYKEISTQEPEKMKEIKKQLNDWSRYEITFEYDKNGFIYLAIIEE